MIGASPIGFLEISAGQASSRKHDARKRPRGGVKKELAE